MIKLGTKVTDKITGFAGIAVSRTEFVYGCVRVRVQPQKLTAEGKIADEAIIDELMLVENNPSNDPPKSFLLGTQDTDVTTGISGMVISVTYYINQGPRVYIQPKGMTSEGRSFEGVVCDLPQLKSEIDKAKKANKPVKHISAGPGDIARPAMVNR